MFTGLTYKRLTGNTFMTTEKYINLSYVLPLTGHYPFVSFTSTVVEVHATDAVGVKKWQVDGS
jgi:hypothetical protein